MRASDQDLMIMARTDALAIEGIEKAIERMHAYLAAGADMSFVEAPESPEQMRRITSGIPAPNMANMVPGGRSPALSAAALEQLGFACVAHPTALSYVMARAARDLLHELRSTGSTAAAESRMMRFDEFNALLGLDEIRARESQDFCGSAREAAVRDRLLTRAAQQSFWP